MVEIDPSSPVYTQEIFGYGLQCAENENDPKQTVPNFGIDVGLRKKGEQGHCGHLKNGGGQNGRFFNVELKFRPHQNSDIFDCLNHQLRCEGKSILKVKFNSWG